MTGAVAPLAQSHAKDLSSPMSYKASIATGHFRRTLAPSSSSFDLEAKGMRRRHPRRVLSVLTLARLLLVIEEAMPFVGDSKRIEKFVCPRSALVDMGLIRSCG